MLFTYVIMAFLHWLLMQDPKKFVTVGGGSPGHATIMINSTEEEISTS